MRFSLNLAGDLDDVALLQDVEHAFDVRLPEDKLWSCETVGDVFTLVAAQLPDRGGKPGRCASTMCFHRLRRTVLTLAPHLELRPSTPISALRPVSVKRLYRAIQAINGLKTPVPHLSAWGTCSLLLAVAAPAGPLLLGISWWMLVPWVLAAAVLLRLAPGRLPPEVRTFGDFVGLVTSWNIGRLAADGARLGHAEVWKTLRTVCESHVGSDGNEIGAGTLLLHPRSAAA